MQFPGYWVSGTVNEINVLRTVFDETDLSDTSNWQEAWQNENPLEDHGYIDPLSMLHDVSRRIVGELASDDLEAIHATMKRGDPFSIEKIEDLARLIQAAIPSVMPTTAASGTSR